MTDRDGRAAASSARGLATRCLSCSDPRVTDRSTVVNFVTRLVREQGQTLGSTIGLELARAFPGYKVQDDGFRNLTHLLSSVPELTSTGRQGADYLWRWAEDADIDVEPNEIEPPSVGAWSSPSVAELRLDRFKAKKFKSLVDIDVPLRPFNIMVGANGAGKSSILQGLYFLSKLRTSRPQQIFSAERNRSLAQLRTLGTEGAIELSFADSIHGVSLTYVGDPRPDALVPHHLVHATTPGWSGDYDFTTVRPPDLPALDALSIMQAFGGATILRFDSRILAQTSSTSQEQPRLRFDGFGLPSVLANLAATDRARLDRVYEATRAIVPTFSAARMPLRKLDAESSDLGHGLELEVHGQWIDASLASEGTLLVLGLMTFAHGVSSTRLLLIEDIDHALHPKAQQALLRHLRDLPSASNLQVVCTTHSPYLLDAVDHEDVLVVRASPQTGHTRCRRLIEHAAWSKWRQSMTPGEFWSFVGEDWLETE